MYGPKNRWTRRGNHKAIFTLTIGRVSVAVVVAGGGGESMRGVTAAFDVRF